jgi:anti-sigma B factor antagonist
MAGLTAEVSYAGENAEAVLIRLSGFIDNTTTPQVEHVIEQQLTEGRYTLVVDLSEVSYISSAGWGVFIGNIREIRDNGGDLLLCGMISMVHNVFELMDFSSLLKEFPDVNTALLHIFGKQYKALDRKKTVGNDPESNRAAMESNSENAGKPSVNVQPFVTSSSTKHGNIAVDHGLQAAQDKLGRRLIQVVTNKPYLKVRQIVRELRLHQDITCSKREVKQRLKMLGLLREQDRYNLALNMQSR